MVGVASASPSSPPTWWRSPQQTRSSSLAASLLPYYSTGALGGVSLFTALVVRLAQPE